MTKFDEKLKTEITYPIRTYKPMMENDVVRDYSLYCVEALDIYFQDRADVYVSGNLFIFLKEDVPSALISPDTFVVFGATKKKRAYYKIWEENNKAPSFIIEITSVHTQEPDKIFKPKDYASLGVEEYFLYDPIGDYLNPYLKGFKLDTARQVYEPIEPTILSNGNYFIHSNVLNLDLRIIDDELRFYDPQTEKILLNHKETEQARLEAEQARNNAVPKLLAMGLSVEQVASALSMSLEEVRRLNER